jgi:hypothetical protein
MHFMQLSDFAAQVNETFLVNVEGQDASFTLVEAAPMRSSALPGQVRDAFSLLFRHEAAVVFPQRTYAMKHRVLGEFGIFLVPVARDRDGFIYQAVFN